MEKLISERNGNLKISNEVIMEISQIATSEVEGVAVRDQIGIRRFTPNISAGTLGARFVSPIKVRLSGETAEIDIAIVVKRGFKAVGVAEAVQNNVKTAVQNMTNITVSKVNVKIVGIKFISARLRN